jgi:phage shock protein E
MKISTMRIRLIQIFALLGALTLASFTAAAEDVWIDVRSYPEHALDNIEGDIRIVHSDVMEEVGTRFPDKNTHIKLYCRSGGRAAKAMEALQQAGYSNVENIGSIDQARQHRGLAQ